MTASRPGSRVEQRRRRPRGQRTARAGDRADPRHAGLAASHRVRRARQRRSGTNHQPAASLHDLASSPARPAPL